MDEAMFDAMQNDPELYELLRLRQGWLEAQSTDKVKWRVEDGKTSYYVDLTKDDIWLRYQDALARRTDAQRAREVAATASLATTNTQLARQQLWLAIIIAAATMAQAIAAIVGAVGSAR